MNDECVSYWWNFGLDNVLKKMPKYPDFDLEWENMYLLGKPSQDNNDDKK